MQIKTAVKPCYFGVEPRIVDTTRQLLLATPKDVPPASHQNNIVYQILCHLDSRYVSRTPKDCNRGLSSTYLKSFFRDIILKIQAHFPALASQSEALKLKLLSPLYGSIFCKPIMCT